MRGGVRGKKWEGGEVGSRIQKLHKRKFDNRKCNLILNMRNSENMQTQT